MLEIKVDDLDLFSKVLNAAAAVLEDEGTFFVTPNDGVTLRNMDKSRFAMVDLKIHPKYFHGEFKCDKEYIISIQMQDLRKILQRAGKEDVLTLKLDEVNDTLNFLFEGRVKRLFILPLTVAEENVLPDPSSLKHNIHAKLRGGAMTDFIKDASIIGGSIKINAESGKMTFSSSQDKKEVSITITTESEDSAALEIEAESPSEALYSIDTFKNLILVDNAFTTVQLSFSSAHPLQLLYQDDRGIELGYLLAPMQPEAEIEEDDSEEAYDDEDWDDDENEDDDEDEE
jgi:proliferating cell nuclear antigen PCNA